MRYSGILPNQTKRNPLHSTDNCDMTVECWCRLKRFSNHSNGLLYPFGILVLRTQNKKRSVCTSTLFDSNESECRRFSVGVSEVTQSRSEQDVLILRIQNRKRSECPSSSFRKGGENPDCLPVGVSGVSKTRSEQSEATSQPNRPTTIPATTIFHHWAQAQSATRFTLSCRVFCER